VVTDFPGTFGSLLQDTCVTTVAVMLANYPGISNVDLARLAVLTPQTVSAIIANPERAGFLVRRPGGYRTGADKDLREGEGRSWGCLCIPLAHALMRSSTRRAEGQLAVAHQLFPCRIIRDYL
jgi:hypothetical protein